MSTHTRRQWTVEALGLISAADLASAWQHSHRAASSNTPPKLRHFDSAMAQEIEAIASQIIPSDGSPGAKEAGVVHFIDSALASWEVDKIPVYERGMLEAQQVRLKLFPGSASIAALSGEQIQRLITEIETSEFFKTLRMHTVLGFLGPNSYGGNRGGVGWAHLGIEDRMMFTPPFGYYDAQSLKEGSK